MEIPAPANPIEESVDAQIQRMIDTFTARNAAGTLTVGQALIGHYYRVLEGPNAGKVIISSHDTIDDKPIIRFANGLTWAWLDTLKDTRCEITRPIFPPAQHPIDYSVATWYGDSGSGPHHHEW